MEWIVALTETDITSSGHAIDVVRLEPAAKVITTQSIANDEHQGKK